MRGLTKESPIVAGIVLAMAAGGVLFIHLPDRRKLERIRSDIAAAKTDLEDKAAKARVIPDLVRQIEAMKSRYEDFDRRLPPKTELGDFLRRLSESLAAEHLTNPVIEPGQPLKEELYHTLPITMRFQGSYLAMAHFLEQVDQIERLTKVQKLSVSIDPDKGVLNVLIQMNIYFTES